jgi:hypothetical protein
MDRASAEVRDRTFERFAAVCAFVVGAAGLVYAVAFVTLLRGAGRVAVGASGILLLVGGLLSTAVLVAVYERVRAWSGPFALWGLVLGSVAAIGSAAHGAFDLANAIDQPRRNVGIPNPVDPRGFLTFGMTAVAVLVLAWLILRSGVFPRGLAYVGFALSPLLLVTYLGRLILLDPKRPVLLVAALLTGFVLNPLWYLWLGIELRRGRT